MKPPYLTLEKFKEKVKKSPRMKGVVGFPAIKSLYEFLYRLLVPKKVEVQGLRMLINPRDKTISRGILERTYEDFEQKIFQRVVEEGKDDMTIVDLGANIGYYTLLASKFIGKNGKVYAFEPNPVSYNYLVKNARLNNFDDIVIPVQKAISDKVGTTKLFLSKSSNLGTHSIFEIEKGRKSIEVDTTTLDDVFGDEKIDVIKMDIEGAEMDAILGGEKVLTKNENLIIFTEFNPFVMEKSRHSPEDFLHKLAEYGFSMLAIDEKRNLLKRVSITDVMSMCPSGEYINLLLFKNNFFSWIKSRIDDFIIE